MALKYKRGLFRLWIVASVVWLAAMASEHGEAIGFYAGYHYRLFTETPSWSAALEKKHRTATVLLLCRQAYESSCVRRDDAAVTQCIRALIQPHNEYDCLVPVCDREVYARNAKALLATVGYPNKGATAQWCDDFQLIKVPSVNWIVVSLVVLPVFVPWLLWLIGAWIVRRFVAARGRPEK